MRLMKFPDGEPCQGCAARVGSEASQDCVTMEMFRGCVESGEPFWCHESTAVPDPEGLATDRHGKRWRRLPDARWRLCRGWIRAVNRKGIEPDL